MSEEIDLDGKNLSIPEDAFEKFQASSVYEDDEFITLSDIVPPQRAVPDHSQELNEIPYDNEVVLGSLQNDESQVNSNNRPQFLDISESNVLSECQQEARGEDRYDDLSNKGISNGQPKQKRQKFIDDLSSDGLGAQNYVIEDSASIIQDSLLSTTVDQSDTTISTPSKEIEGSSYPRRTKRGRIPNTAKYPMTANSSINTTGKRRPGRPKKVTPVQTTFEPDSTNIDNVSLLTGNGSRTDGSGLDESTLNDVVRKSRRARPKTSLKEYSEPKPSNQGRKNKSTSLADEGINNSQSDVKVLVEVIRNEDESQMDLDSLFINNDVNSPTLSTSKRKKKGSKKGKKISVEPTNTENLIHSDNNSDLNDDADDVCLSKLKQGLQETGTVANSEGNLSIVDVQFEGDAEPFVGFDNETEDNLNDVISKTKVKSIEAEYYTVPNSADDTISEDIIGNNPTKRNSKMPINSDFEYNVDKAVKEATADDQTNMIDVDECLLVEDTSKRRRTAKKTFVYDEGSDEDPFANVESSDDEPKRKKKGNKNYSDDEYVPDGGGRKRGGKIRSSSSESEDEFNDDLDDLTMSKKRNVGLSPFKKGRKKSHVSTIITHPVDPQSIVSTIVAKTDGDDIEGCLETTMIKIDESLKPPAEAWATSNEFENFIAKKTHGTSLKIKKVSSKEKTEILAPLDIPVVHQNEPKKTAETSTQTKKQETSSVSVQTCVPYDVPMISNISLTPAQSEKACEFLSSVVKTTVELGHLMSKKSNDFMSKKINTDHVIDTFKMDYCVKKSFLLFKLAKHNLLQMEEDLTNQYEAFLVENNLSSCREAPKEIVPQTRADSDSDCEIIEVVGASGSTATREKPKDSATKLVFLNKELSIKIAKKPSTPKPVEGKKKLEIKGRHAVWINKNVMVKKVTPTQSFLAQDSRNKKPPDTYVTKKMVSDFFEDYNRMKALYMCAPFINNDWNNVRREYACHYFVNELDAANTSRDNNALNADPTENNIETSDEISNFNEISSIKNTKSLFSLCIEAIRKCLSVKNNQAQATQKLTCNVTDGTDTKGPVALFRLCVNILRTDHLNLYKTQEENDIIKINNLLDLPDQKNTEFMEDVIEETNDWSDQYNMQENNTNEEDNILCDIPQHNVQVIEDIPIHAAVLPLTRICYQKILKMFFQSETYQENCPILIPDKVSVNNIGFIDGYYNIDGKCIHQEDMSLCPSDREDSMDAVISQDNYRSKSLITLCVELIQRLQRLPEASPVETTTWHTNFYELKSLKSIALESIKHFLYLSGDEDITEPVFVTETNNETEINENFTINCVNTLSEEAFESIHVPSEVRIRKQSQGSSNYSDEFDNDGCDDEMNFNAYDEADDNGWASQLQLQEFRSCFNPHVDTIENVIGANNDTPPEVEQHEHIPQIKSEPIDYFAEENIVDTSIVKTEPIQALHTLIEMTHIPDSLITKKELAEATNDRGGSPQLQGGSSYNVESFEEFVATNKMIQSMDESDHEIFSQSALRIRRQHEPDVDQGHDTSMSLLVPHTFEPLHIVEAKGSLMETSSDEDENSYKKNAGKKKDKRKRKTKKDAKVINSKDTPVVKEKTVPECEVALLTRKMRDKIRQEEKKIASSESDSDSLYTLSSKKDKSKNNKGGLEEKKAGSSGIDAEPFNGLSKKKDDKKDNDNIKQTKNKHSSAEHSKENKQKDDEVQCNNVDSTEKSYDPKKTKTKEADKFSGFTAIDQNEINNYQKLMQFVYDKIIPSDHEDIDENANKDEDSNSNTGPIINPDEPVELLECEPTIPLFDEPKARPGPKKSKIKVIKSLGIIKETQFTDRHGWHCYPINVKEVKLYKNVQILLEKLPESFVETYMQYQDVMDKDLEDQEVDRLINLQSLNRSINIKDFKDGKQKNRVKGANKEGLISGQNSGNISGSTSPTFSDNFDELAPSDDEGPTVEDEIPPPMPVRSSENNMAKNLLMDDHDSDSDDAGGNKLKNPDDKVAKPEKPRSKTKGDKFDPESLMLTADKMMNKELNLLHAPIVLQDDANETIAKEINTSPKEDTKSSKKSSKKYSKDRVKNDDDSSSEEEKQWVSTKEKLLKRMGKKEDAVADDAKRAKLVNEFIERRSESDRKNKRESHQGRKGRARRKLLERQKQIRFLSNELYNEGDGVTTGKRGTAAGLFKGRRNIRKVIDKKSLSRSTVVANMEEFERKRRLNMRQNKLREVLGCEEDVNVLVINDEVCLEYDFKEQRPVVTVHQFFTKVMKAHQYEGVKFMWDACFESLGTIESGHGGGGCILAHCMGLGKTLQVLALLHTVLTHPRANMHRVLVCCPLSTVLNWVDEIHKWIGPVTHEIKVFELSKLRKTYERAYQLEDWYNGGGIFIIGYELFRSLTTLDPEIDAIRPTIINKIRNALLDPGPDIIVCDEGHLLKNDCSVLAVAMSRVVTKRRIVLTGTPMQNNLREYFCMVNFIKPNLLGTYSEYSNRFENPIMNGQHRDSVVEDIKLMKARTHILHKVLEGCLQRQEASVLYPYLPKKHEYTVFIPLTQCQWDLYNHYMDNYAKTNKQSVLRDFHILQKIWSHPQVLHSFQMKARDKKDKIKVEKIEDDLALADQEADIKPAETEVWWLQYLGEGAMLDSLDSSNKFVAVFRILHECVSLGDKVLIFSTSLFCLDGLEFFLKKINKWSLGQEYYRLDGSVPAEVRQKWCREFNAENNIKTKLFLISTRAGCLGLNMTAANRVIILDTSWNPAHDIQSIFRVYRFGQKKDCYIYRLVALGTMEQKIYERSVTKQAVACRVVDEQQIDRHYNLAELNELYSVDEMGLSVAGGVAVGVGDVVLLRVARDAAIHAVHEHDSLLRGSGEQGLPEHERAAAWNQFQQEHEHKQMQNDLNANKAKVALKRLEMEHLRQQALYSATTESSETVFKSEPAAEEYPFLVPKDEPGKHRGRKPKRSNIVQCRIPIASGPQPGTSTQTDEDNQQDMVQKITTLLIKHNFMQNKSGPRQITELVSKVKKMVTTGQPIALGPGYDELSSSIANVLLRRDEPMPALTDIEVAVPEPKKKSGRPKKPQVIEAESPVIEHEIPVPPLVPIDSDVRSRRKAALAAEMYFDAQRDVIDLDDDGDDWQNDTEIVDTEEPVIETQPVPEPQPVTEKNKRLKKGKKQKEFESSILLSDDEATPEVVAPATPATTTTSVDNEVVALHPSLLTNSNFIKIVAHTYLAGNPMMDEDAATLAAQYSTLKTLKESESEGKPIESGAVYDIAIQVLGKEVLRKLQAANPKTSGSGDSSDASKKLQSLLGENKLETPAPTVKKVKIGPKSKVSKDVKQEPMESRQSETKKTQKKIIQLGSKVVSLTKTSLFAQSSSSSFTPSNISTSREESILPDEEIQMASEPAAAHHHDRVPIILRKVKLERRSILKTSTAPAMPVALGRGPAPQAPPSNATICLDSDEDEAAPVPLPPPQRRKRTIQMPIMTVQNPSAPVPVAITGPNARPIPLPPPAPVPPSTPTFYTLSPCGTRAILLGTPQPVPISMTGPNGASQPVPVSLLGPGSHPVPISFTGPGGSKFQTLHSAAGRTQPEPISLIGPNSQPIPISLSGPGVQAGTQAYGVPASQPVPMSLVDSSGRPVAFSSSNMMHTQSPLTLRFTPTQPPQTLSVLSTSSTPSALTNARLLSSQPKANTAVGTNKANKPTSKQTSIPNNTYQITKVAANVLNFKLDRSNSDVITHTIVDDEPVSTPIASKPVEVSATPSVKSQKEVPKMPKRRIMSSSSSSSGGSRSSSPDPLAILKDVVHIQAPEKQTATPPPNATPPRIPAPVRKMKSSNIWPVKASSLTPKPSPAAGRPKADLKGKQGSSSVDLTAFVIPKNTNTSSKKVSGSVDLRNTNTSSKKQVSGSVDLKNTNTSSKKQVSGSVDLTSVLANQGTKNRTKNSKESGFYRIDSPKPTAKAKLDTAKPSVPTKLVGTSKSIILDGKSKVLKVEPKSTAASIQGKSSKVIASSSTSKPKSTDKRPAPPTSAPTPKKRKTELMTLKDFDIDDIDDIIELD